MSPSLLRFLAIVLGYAAWFALVYLKITPADGFIASLSAALGMTGGYHFMVAARRDTQPNPTTPEST